MNPASEAAAILESVWASLSDRRVPIDPIRIASHLGIEVLMAELPPTVAGAIAKRPGRDPRILINRHDHPNRQRFTCAHELGHYVQRTKEPDAYEFIDFRGPLASAGTDEGETFANAFAANLIMPADEIRRRARHARSAVELAYEFRVSQEAMTYRLSDLGIDVGTRPRD